MATSLKNDEELKGRVQDLAARTDRSPHWIMREAIRQYVEREEARDVFVREALAPWTSYRETGLHLTGDEVLAWLETWDEERREAPICHT